MTPKSNLQTGSLPDWYDPFPEPRTFPAGWDLSELLAAVRESSRETGDSSAAEEPAVEDDSG